MREDVILAAAVDVERAALREGLDDVVRVGVCEFTHQYVRREHHLVVVIKSAPGRVAISVGEVAKLIVVDDVQNLELQVSKSDLENSFLFVRRRDKTNATSPTGQCPIATPP